MRGVSLDRLVSVRLAGELDPDIVSFRTWLARKSAVRNEQILHERALEREQLEGLLQTPIATLLDPAALLRAFAQRIHGAPTHSCMTCQHWGEDRYRPGGNICWLGWVPGQRPRVLHALTACASHALGRGAQDALTQWLVAHRIHYSPQRWQAHREDLARQAGAVRGFSLGSQWEHAVRAWLTTRYGADFFLPERWLIAVDTTGTRHYREVDGIERVSADTAYVYEIKHHTAAADTLLEEYVPWLERACPGVTWSPIEVNAANAYQWSPMPRGTVVLPRIEARTVGPVYQLWIPDARDIPRPGATP